MFIKKLMQEITFIGGIIFYLIICLLFLFIKEYSIFLFLILGLFLIYFITLLIRIFYFKPRPKKQEYQNFIQKIDASSFPSVHAARTTFLSLFLLIYSFNIFITIIALILSVLVFYSRIYLKKHDIVDVFVGIILGIFSFILSFLIF
jgi:undecaprenyl-diphosphatase